MEKTETSAEDSFADFASQRGKRFFREHKAVARQGRLSGKMMLVLVFGALLVLATDAPVDASVALGCIQAVCGEEVQFGLGVHF
jgi:hypothetical protein